MFDQQWNPYLFWTRAVSRSLDPDYPSRDLTPEEEEMLDAYRPNTLSMDIQTWHEIGNELPICWEKGDYSPVPMNGRQVDVSYVDFSDNLWPSGSKLERLIATETTFSNVVLNGVSLKGGKFTRCTFYDTKLDGADLSEVHITQGGNKLFSGCSLAKANLTRARITGIAFRSCFLEEANLTESIWKGCSFFNIRFADACWSRARFEDCTFDYCNLGFPDVPPKEERSVFARCTFYRCTGMSPLEDIHRAWTILE